MTGVNSHFTWRFSSNFSRRKKSLKKEFERVALSQLSNLYAAGYYLTKNESEAEGLVEETYLRAFRLFDNFKRDTNCRAWLLSILRQLFVTRYRKEEHEPETVDWGKVDKSYECFKHEGEKVTQFFSGFLNRDIEETLRALPEDFRMAITLVDVEDLSYEEAASVMECSIGTVRSRVSRGRRMLQVALRDCAVKKGATSSLPSSS